MLFNTVAPAGVTCQQVVQLSWQWQPQGGGLVLTQQQQQQQIWSQLLLPLLLLLTPQSVSCLRL
jgi:hypothetical protein